MLFIAAVALIAAALGDPLVESIANTGAFGPAYRDDNHLSVLPTLFAGLALVLGVAALRAIALLRAPRSGKSGGWRDVAIYLSAESHAWDFPLVLGLQLAAVCMMENIEQLAAHGTFVSGFAWLGAPALISLAAHAAIGAICLRAVQRLTREIAEGCRSLVRIVLACMLIMRRTALVLFSKRHDALCEHTRAAYGERIRGRAPPFSPTPA